MEVCPPKPHFGGQTWQKNKFVHQIGHLVDKLYVCGPASGQCPCSVPNYVRLLEQLLLADRSNELLKVERLKVGHIFKEAGIEGCHGWDEHG